jgi:tRNA modification GTPase
MTASDTIYALSSGAGRSAIAIIRISGSHTPDLLVRMAGRLPPARRMSLRAIRDGRTGEVLDKAMVVWFPGPGSFTGEDCAEIHLHGSPAVVSAVMALLSSLPGVRPAEPGEFTRRGFLNGKMDLVEAEGLGDLLQARTSGQRRQAFRQMSGQASSRFESWREQLMQIRAHIEAGVDFADEPGVAEAAAPAIDMNIQALHSQISAELRRSTGSELLRDGFRVVLAGCPNTGKSSLLNVLAGREAAIVSDLPGTTRDAIEVTLELDGMPVIVTDTAGLRSNVADAVEEEGVRRSRQHVSGADLVVWVWSADVMGSKVLDTSIEQPDVLVENKYDLLENRLGLLRNDADGSIRISCQTREGIAELLAELTARLRERFGDVESALFVSARQKLAAERSVRHLKDALGIGSDRLELKAESIRFAAEEIGRLTGRVDVEEWLGAIFSRFCIGK